MKKITSIALVTLLAVSFTSCKKDWSCTCKDKEGKETAKYTFPKVKKSDAETGCNAWNTGASMSGGKCELN